MATALVSEPPRPSVEMRLSGAMPWKPATTATCPSPKRLTSSEPSMSAMRAAPCAPSVRIGTCQPCQERALTPIDCSAIASRPEVTCSPDATIASYSRASKKGLEAPVAFGMPCTQPTSSLVLPDMAETTTATSWPASTSRLTCRATLWMRSRSATEVPPNFITMRAMKAICPWICGRGPGNEWKPPAQAHRMRRLLSQTAPLSQAPAGRAARPHAGREGSGPARCRRPRSG